MKFNIVMTSSGKFEKVDLYARKWWRLVQHIANEFWARREKKFLIDLQSRQKRNEHRRNCQVGDIVLMKDNINHKITDQSPELLEFSQMVMEKYPSAN